MTKKVAIVGAFGAAVALALSPILPAQAATVKEWGVWSTPSTQDGSGNGTLNFTNSNLIDATYEYSLTDSIESANSDDGAWFNADSPIGAVYGASGPFAVAHKLRIDADAADNSILTVTFATPVPAGQLAFAVGDVDDDQVTITGTGVDNVDLTGDELKGTGSDHTFNFCVTSETEPSDCFGDTDVPVLTTNANDLLVEGAEVGNSSDGASAWFQPSVAVKSIRFESEIWGDPGETGHHDFWFAQSGTGSSSSSNSLANTGSNSDSIAMMIGLGSAFLFAGSLMVSRRKNS